MRIRWQDPPPVRAPGKTKATEYKYNYIARACRKNPGRWAVLPTSVGTGFTARLRTQPAFKGLEMTTRVIRQGKNKGRFTLYVRLPLAEAEESVVSEAPSANGSQTPELDPQIQALLSS